MIQHEYRAVEIERGGFIHETGDVVIVAPLSENEELLLAFPGDDIPNLMLLLARIYAQNLSGQDSRGSLGHTISVDNAQFLPVKGREEVALIAELSAGTPVSFSVPRAVAATLRDQLNDLL